MYISSILWYLSWPAFIAGSFFLIRWIVSKAEQKDPTAEDSD